jgi:hypothetical protein
MDRNELFQGLTREEYAARAAWRRWYAQGGVEEETPPWKRTPDTVVPDGRPENRSSQSSPGQPMEAPI